jgi:thymidylate kinase
VRNGYLYLAKNKRFRIMDGTQSVETIHKNILREIELLEKGK